MLWITWSLTISDEKALLNSVAERVLARARRATSDAHRVFQELSAFDAEACSPRHIALMRRLVFNTPSIEEIGYFEEGRLRCTSWGLTETVVPLTPPDFVMQDGLGMTFGVRPALLGGAVKLALGSGPYNALVDPVRFIDVIAEPQILMALATSDGRIVSRSGDADEAVLAELARAPRTGIDANLAFSAVRSGDWTAIALEPRPQIYSTLRREQLMLLPIGLFIASLIVSIVVWFSRRRLSFQAEIATAIRNGEFEVHYQPIVELRTGHCVGAEALIRWRRPDGSWVRPDLFIPVAEETGMIGEITGLVIEAVGRDLGRELARDPALHIGINLAPDDFKTDKVLDRLLRLTATLGLAPGQIWIEATERGFIDYEAARDVISKAHAAGYKVSIDDFGTGYSSLTHLQQIAFDALKIDKSFVDTIGVPSAKSAVIFHIIEMAKALGATLIAEGVEEQAQADYLRENGVELAQGWLYSRALPAGEFKAYLAAHPRAG